ncbi:hypothetical protein [Aliarcobacter butzleri]|uniref:hypothetical protein n=1 Tax=Aliarcobacter butzleri TaxID=28197 RepID=UPI001EDAB42F|nr:hypothetical protein [Aliarcobacter butzleri]MCG3655990.1 hypothetical protein [Aliarcobacter butzleri]
MDYNFLLGKLRKDISELNLKRHKLTDNQKSMLDFIEGKKNYSQYILNGRSIQITRGNMEYGLEHILYRHYQDTSNGKLTPREILNLWSIIEKGSPITNYEQEKKGDFAYRLFKEIPPHIKEETKLEIKENLIIKNEKETILIDIDLEVKKEINKILKENTEKIRLLLVFFEEKNFYNVLTFYSDREFIRETGDLS